MFVIPITGVSSIVPEWVAISIDSVALALSTYTAGRILYFIASKNRSNLASSNPRLHHPLTRATLLLATLFAVARCVAHIAINVAFPLHNYWSFGFWDYVMFTYAAFYASHAPISLGFAYCWLGLGTFALTLTSILILGDHFFADYIPETKRRRKMVQNGVLLTPLYGLCIGFCGLYTGMLLYVFLCTTASVTCQEPITPVPSPNTTSIGRPPRR